MSYERYHFRECLNPHISQLWLRYSRLRAARDELHLSARAAPWSELEELDFEHEKLEPLLLELDAIAMQIADAKANSQKEIRLIAEVLLDHVDGTGGDAAHRLALSLCRSILDLPEVHNLGRKRSSTC